MARNIRIRPDAIGQDFNLMISAGKVPGVTAVTEFGRNVDMANGIQETLWGTGGLFVPLTTAQPLNIVSSDAQDNPAGTGAAAVRVWGLTAWDAAETSEKVSLDGLSSVQTVNDYVIVNKVKVTGAGSGRTNAGNIVVSGDTDGTTQATVRTGRAQTEQGVYGVPENKVAFITEIVAAITSNNAATMELDMYAWEHADRANPIRVDKGTVAVSSNGANTVSRVFQPYLRIEGPIILELAATATANNSSGTGSFDLILCDSPLPF